MSGEKPEPQPPRWRRLRRVLSLTVLVVPPLLGIVALAVWLAYVRIDHMLVERFEGRTWDFPSKLYAAAYPIYPGLAVDEGGFYRRLTRLGYRQVKGPLERRGEYRKIASPRAIEIYLNAFAYPTHREPGRLLRLELDRDGRLIRIVSLDDGTEVYDTVLEPVVLAGLHGAVAEDRRAMKLEEVPLPLIRTIIAVEDRRFFDHPGVDPRGLLRAAVVNVKAGGIRQGGSTLTQQLMKNFFLTEARTLSRKLRELALAVVTELHYSKSQILEFYLNEIYMGQRGAVGIHGMWEAARYYFEREPRELTLGQIATLAGMIRAPNYYSPHLHPARARSRRDVVLNLLLDEKEIDVATYEAAIAEDLDVVPPRPPSQGSPYFVDFVRRELVDRYPSAVLTSEGYSIFTSLDEDLQVIAETAVSEGLAQLERDYPSLTQNDTVRLEGALIAINPRTGAVLAMVGGREYRKSQYNRVTDARRQPGSIFKPIVYLAALGSSVDGDAHFRASSLVSDEPFVWEYEGGQTWSPANYKDEYLGRVTVHDALVFSLNAATARIARDVGLRAVRDLAVRLGISPELPAYPAIVLGGWEISPLEVAKVYGAIANAGLGAEPLAVSKVVDRHGRILEGHHIAVDRKVSAVDAYLVTHVMQEVINRGTGQRVRSLGLTRAAAGKTGTTNDYNDAWFAGFTPDLLAVVWVGFDHSEKLGLSGSQAAVPIWTAFMKEAIAARPPRQFDVPQGVSIVRIDRATGLRAGFGCRDTVLAAFVEGEEPDAYCNEHGPTSWW